MAFSACVKIQNDFSLCAHDYGTDNICDKCGHAYSLGLKYTWNGKEYTVSGIGNCIDKNIVIPNTYNGYRVTAIGKDAFLDCRDIIRIEIPNSVISIGNSAFLGCSSLISVDLPDGVTFIGDNAFSGCASLTSIVIPNGVTFIGDHLFYGCSSLESVTIPESITSIGERAFFYCKRLTTILIPKNVTFIDIYAFSGCNALRKVYYGGNLSQWGAVNIGQENTSLSSMNLYYYSESEPTLNSDGTAYDGNYWHFVDGGVVEWVWVKPIYKLTLKELRANVEYYNGCDVEFEGVVTRNYNNGVYVEEYDEETDRYYAMYVYYGFNLNGYGMEILNVGNRVRIVGSLQYWEVGGTYQVTDLQYRIMNHDDPNNIQNIGDEGVTYSAAYSLTSAYDFANGKVKILTYVDEEAVMVEHSIASLSMNTSISMESLKVSRIYTTNNDESSSKGAMTLTCYAEDGTKITVRTDVLKDENGVLITQSAYEGKTIDVKGFVDYYDGEYQIKVLSYKDIIVH